MNRNIKKITEGAFMCAIVGMFLFLDRQTAGFFTQYITFLIPLPLLIYTAKYGMRYAAIAYVSLIVIAFMLSLPQTVLYVVNCGITGIVYGYGVRKQKGNYWLLTVTILFTTVMYLLSTVLLASFFGYDIHREVLAMSDAIHGMLPVFSSEQIYNVAKLVVPILTFTTAFMEGFLVHLLANFLLKRLHIKVSPPKSLYYVKGPIWLGAALIGIILLNFFKTNMGLPANILDFITAMAVISIIILNIYGLIVILLVCAVYKMKYIPMIVALLIFVLFPFVALIGAIDCLTNVREIILKRGTHAR